MDDSLEQDEGQAELEAIALELQGEHICIGDLISLVVTTPDGEGSIFGGGILDDHVELAVAPPVFDDCVFQVCLRNRLSASMQWQAFMQKRRQQESDGVELSEEEEEQAGAFQQTLERVKANEQKLNTSLFEQKCGEQIHFGDVIQLRHRKSGKWLTVSPDEVAATERENLRVHLHADGTTCSWFTVLPSVTVDEEGMPVENASRVIFGVTDRTDEFLHYSAGPVAKREGLGAALPVVPETPTSSQK